VTPADILAAADDLISRSDAATAGIWGGTGALLARQALESAVTRYWQDRPETSGMTSCPMRSQLVCLPFYLDRDTARRAAYTWAALSNACHYHTYELSPTAPELTGWIDNVRALITHIESADATGSQGERR
jgi:hypothetical protein